MHEDGPSKFLDQEYRGAKLGRVIGLGGTSSKWGGQMITLSDSDFKNNDKNFKYVWPINFSTLAKYFKIVFTSLGLSNYEKEDDSIVNTHNLITKSRLGNIFNLRVSSWIPFKRISIKDLNYSKNSKLIDVWVDCKLESLSEGSWLGESIQNLTFIGEENRKLTVSSKKFVITMGALESTRQILMLHNSLESEDKMTQSFCDHISVCVGELKITNEYLFYSYFYLF